MTNHIEMKIIEYTHKERKVWDSFVEDSGNGTIFALQRFFDYHPKTKFNHRHLMFYKQKELVAVFPSAEVIRDGTKTLISHPGASFGGFILGNGTGISDAISLVDALINYAKDSDFGKIILTRPPWIYYKSPEDHIDFSLFNAGAKHIKRELTAVLQIKQDFDENLSLFRPTARTAMRKAQKSGVTIRLTDDYEAFYRILKENLSMRHNVAPTHSLEEILHLKKLLDEKIFLFGAYIAGKMIAGTIVFIFNDRAILAFYISQDYEHQNIRPLNLLFAELIKWAVEKGFHWLDFGTYTLDNVPNLGLARFKESLGATGIFRDTFQVELT